MNVDQMLAHVGDFGLYQWILMGLFAIINILSSFHYFAQTFISVEPEYQCIPKFGTIVEQTSKTIVPSSFLEEILIVRNGENDLFQCTSAESVNEACTNGWNFTLQYGYSSIIDDLNWVCDESWKPTMGQSLFFVGSVIGSMVLGIIADRIGRLHVLVIAYLIAFIGNMLTMLATSFPVFAIGRFVAGIATDSNFLMMYIIVMEYIRPSMRTFGLNLTIGVFYCLGCMIVPWVAVLSHTWRYFLLYISLPFILVLSFYLLVPESAQWLLSQKKFNKAITCFQRIAKINSKEFSKEAIQDLRKYCELNISDTKKSGNLLSLFRTPCLRRKTCILIFKSMVITLCYDAISRNINGLDISPFIMFSITSATILPACLLILVFQDVIGRKATACSSLFICGIITSATGIILAIVHHPDCVLTLTLAIIARFGINVAYNSGAQYAVELIPTEVRGQGVAAVHVAGYAATFFSSHILYLRQYNRALPELIIGVLCVLGSVACLFLPETLHRVLPVTIEDGENFGEDERVFDFACCGKYGNEVPTTSTAQLFEDSKGPTVNLS